MALCFEIPLDTVLHSRADERTRSRGEGRSLINQNASISLTISTRNSAFEMIVDRNQEWRNNPNQRQPSGDDPDARQPLLRARGLVEIAEAIRKISTTRAARRIGVNPFAA